MLGMSFWEWVVVILGGRLNQNRINTEREEE
jgi:hypothetical protein